MGFPARLAALCVSGLVCSFPLAAATVCVCVVESGLSAEAAPVEASSAWEAGLMAAFFDAGHIVTNAAIVRVPSSADEGRPTLPDRKFGAMAAKDGGADVLSVVVLDYRGTVESAESAARPSPSGVAYRILDLGSGSVIAEGVDERQVGTDTATDEAREAGRLARIMMTRLKEW